MTASSLIQRYLAAAAAVRIDTAVLDHLTRTMLDLPMSYFAARRTGTSSAGSQAPRDPQFLVEAASAESSTPPRWPSCSAAWPGTAPPDGPLLLTCRSTPD